MSQQGEFFPFGLDPFEGAIFSTIHVSFLFVWGGRGELICCFFGCCCGVMLQRNILRGRIGHLSLLVQAGLIEGGPKGFTPLLVTPYFDAYPYGDVWRIQHHFIHKETMTWLEIGASPKPSFVAEEMTHEFHLGDVSDTTAMSCVSSVRLGYG